MSFLLCENGSQRYIATIHEFQILIELSTVHGSWHGIVKMVLRLAMSKLSKPAAEVDAFVSHGSQASGTRRQPHRLSNWARASRQPGSTACRACRGGAGVLSIFSPSFGAGRSSVISARATRGCPTELSSKVEKRLSSEW